VRTTLAVWLTGLSGSGKSAIAAALLASLHANGMEVARLESDALRALLTPFPRYDEAERDRFYELLAELGVLLIERNVSVVIDATANKRAYRDAARRRIARFAEIHVDTPLEVCEARDPKGLYRRARAGDSSTLPGLQAAYQEPLAPELVVRGDRGTPAEAAGAIMQLLEERGWISR
jgi:adenylylsulfate kinase